MEWNFFFFQTFSLLILLSLHYIYRSHSYYWCAVLLLSLNILSHILIHCSIFSIISPIFNPVLAFWTSLYLKIMYMNNLISCMSVHCMHAWCHGGQKRCSIPWNGSYRPLWAVMWVLGIGPRSYGRATYLPTDPSLQPCPIFLYSFKIIFIDLKNILCLMIYPETSPWSFIPHETIEDRTDTFENHKARNSESDWLADLHLVGTNIKLIAIILLN